MVKTISSFTFTEIIGDGDGIINPGETGYLIISLKNAFEDTTDRYQLGVLSSFDFIQAKQRYESAVSENIRAKFDYIFKLKVLEFYFGIPLTIPAN